MPLPLPFPSIVGSARRRASSCSASITSTSRPAPSSAKDTASVDSAMPYAHSMAAGFNPNLAPTSVNIRVASGSIGSAPLSASRRLTVPR